MASTTPTTAEPQTQTTLTDLVKHAFDSDDEFSDTEETTATASTTLNFKDLKPNGIYYVYPSKMFVSKFGSVCFLLELADIEKPNELFSCYAPSGYREKVKQKLGDQMTKHIMKYLGMGCNNGKKRHEYKIKPIPKKE